MSSIAAAPALENVLYEKRDGIAYVTVNRPKVLNSLNGKTIAELTTVFEEAGKDSEVLRRHPDRVRLQSLCRGGGHQRTRQSLGC